MTSLACQNSNDLTITNDFTYQDFYRDVCAVLKCSKNISYEKRSKLIQSRTRPTELSEISDEEASKSLKRNNFDDESSIEKINKRQKKDISLTDKRYVLCGTEKHLPNVQGSQINNLNNSFQRYSQSIKLNHTEILNDLTVKNDFNNYSINSQTKWDEKEVTYLIFFVNKLRKSISFPNLFDEILAKYGQYFNNRNTMDLKIKYNKLLNEEKILFDYFKMQAKLLEEELETTELNSSKSDNLVKNWCKTEIMHLVFFVSKLGNCWYDISTKHKKYFRNRSANDMKSKYNDLRVTSSIFEYFKKKAELLEGKKLIELISLDEKPQHQQNIKYSDKGNKSIESNPNVNSSKDNHVEKVQRISSAAKVTADEGYISNEFWQSFAYPFITNIQAIENVNVL
jgi:hypothetical protein